MKMHRMLIGICALSAAAMLPLSTSAATLPGSAAVASQSVDHATMPTLLSLADVTVLASNHMTFDTFGSPAAAPLALSTIDRVDARSPIAASTATGYSRSNDHSPAAVGDRWRATT